MSKIGQKTLSEVKSKKLLAKYGIDFADEIEVFTISESVVAAEKIGYPVVVKVCGDLISHKSERGLVRLKLSNAADVEQAASDLSAACLASDGETSLLISKMESGRRELIIGLIRDEQFGSFVMLGLGGVFAEVLSDTVFAMTPLGLDGALTLIDRLNNQDALGDFRGEKAINRLQLAEMLVSLSNIERQESEIHSIDINPVLARADGSLVAVDALIELRDNPTAAKDEGKLSSRSISDEHFAALFSPRGVVVVGASTHPGKFGFVTLHNILTNGYLGRVFATHLERAKVLDIECLKSVEELPVDTVDLAIICTPASTNVDILRACANKKIKAVYLTSAGYADSGSYGLQAQIELSDLANSLGILLIGPNGQGFVSTPQRLCAQIVGPYPPSGVISLVSQSGNFVSTFMNYSRQTGVGIARAVSAGNAAQIGLPEFFDYFAKDPATKVSLAYLEGIGNGKQLAESMRQLSKVKPLVLVKGGVTIGGARAAASHTGALASNDRIFEGVCSSTGTIRISDVELAFDVAATLATQPMPKGNNIIVLTTVGGWGVVTADVIVDENVLNLMQLPNHLEAAISELLPQRWSKNNPIDCAGGETRETVAEVMRLVASDRAVDAVIFLGIGIQSNQARMMREGSYFPNFELERIVTYHERQDEMYAKVAADLSQEFEKPILIATELGVADPNNPGVLAVKNTGRHCYSSGQRAARALSSVYQYAKWRELATHA